MKNQAKLREDIERLHERYTDPTRYGDEANPINFDDFLDMIVELAQAHADAEKRKVWKKLHRKLVRQHLPDYDNNERSLGWNTILSKIIRHIDAELAKLKAKGRK